MRRQIGAICLLLAALASPLPAGAVATYYFELPGINGEASAPGHTGLLEVLSFSWGLAGPGGPNDIHDLTFVTPISGATPELLNATASGTLFPIAHLYAYSTANPNQTLLYEIALGETVLTAISPLGLNDIVSLRFETFALTCNDSASCIGVPGVVPEPGILALLGLGLAGLGFTRRKLH